MSCEVATARHLQFDDGGRSAAGYKGKTGDCVVRSIAIATGLPYQQIYDLVNGAAVYERTCSAANAAICGKVEHYTMNFSSPSKKSRLLRIATRDLIQQRRFGFNP